MSCSQIEYNNLMIILLKIKNVEFDFGKIGNEKDKLKM